MGAGMEDLLRNIEGFVRKVKGRRLLLVRSDAAESVLEAGVVDRAEPEEWAGAAPFHNKGRGRMYRLRLSGESGRCLIVKSILRGGIPALISRRLHFSRRRLFLEAELSNLLCREKVPAAEMIFGRAERVAGPFHRLHLATAEINDAVPLLALLKDDKIPFPEKQAAVRGAGKSVRALHEAGVRHADLNLANLLVAAGGGKEGEPSLAGIIDLSGSRIRSELSERDRTANLARLLRHAVKNGLHGRLDLAGLWRSFMEGYCRGDERTGFGERVIRAFRRTYPLHRLSWRLHRIAVPPFSSGRFL